MFQQFTSPVNWKEVNEAFSQGSKLTDGLKEYVALFEQVEDVILALIPAFRNHPACLLGKERHDVEQAEIDLKREAAKLWVAKHMTDWAGEYWRKAKIFTNV